MNALIVFLAMVSAADAELLGLWEAKRLLGPDVKGELVLVEGEGGHTAQIAGYSAPVTSRGGQYTFTLPDAKGSFRGKAAGERIEGFWIQPGSGLFHATPVTLRRERGHWRGTVTPLQESFTLYLPVKESADGRLAAYLRNPERNQGIFWPVKWLERDGERVKLVGGRDGKTPLFEGRFERGRITVPFGNRGVFEFEKVDQQQASPFYPRGRNPARYRYSPPLERDDGWPVATLEEVGISRPAIEVFIQKIMDAPMDSLGASQIHSVLIARHGKLVLEEYFHGHHRDQSHDTRSAAKSVAAILVGAAMHAGLKVSESTPVYETMLGRLPADIDPRKRAMRLEHLLTMTGGHFCDDNDENAPGNEDKMQDQDRERDWYRYILALPMDRTPGERLVYCSVDAHLAGGVLAKAVNEALPELFDRLVAKPLRMGPYHMLLSPLGDGYMGGGTQFVSRDFLKLAQLMADEGAWQGRRIFSSAWAHKSGAGLRDIGRSGQKYGYLWNSYEYPYRGRKVHAVFAAGNGGQISMAIPELGLAIAFTGGNYADAALFIPQRKLIPEQILPAVEERR